MVAHSEILNHFLVDVFNEILLTEEACLSAVYQDLSLRELHLIEEVCLAVDNERDNCATAIAAAQRITAGTLTTAVTLLENKGYLERQRDTRDKRVVRILPTQRGRDANDCHSKFHQEMVDSLLATLTAEAAEIFVRTIGGLAAFFRTKYKEAV